MTLRNDLVRECFLFAFPPNADCADYFTLSTVCLVQGSELIMAYDEHTLTHCFKFGVIYQRFGQVRIVIIIREYLWHSVS